MPYKLSQYTNETIIQVKLPDQEAITGLDSSITVSFTSYNNLGSLMFMDDEFSSSILSVNVLGVEKVNTMMMINNDQFSLKFGNSIPFLSFATSGSG